jgi:lysine 2,3-aminomutase
MDAAHPRHNGADDMTKLSPDAIRRYCEQLCEACPTLHGILERSRDVRTLRRDIGLCLARRQDPEVHSAAHVRAGNSLEEVIAGDAIRVMRSLLTRRNERVVGFSPMLTLRHAVRGRLAKLPSDLAAGFFEEFVHLFKAIEGTSGVYRDRTVPKFLRMEGRAAAIERSRDLDALSSYVTAYLARYPTGLDPTVVEQREQSRARILAVLGGVERDWKDWRWHTRHVARTAEALRRMVTLSPRESAAISEARAHGVPFGVTPYYAHLMDPGHDRVRDHAIRAQVLPPQAYVAQMAAQKDRRGQACDFMRERDTSPVPLITRRYPMICILKPYNACAQVCVYCQRNWEIEDVLAEGAMAKEHELDAALRWIEQTTALREVLVTGGDPLVMSNRRLGTILRRLAKIGHIERIRLGTRMPVAVPARIDAGLLALLEEIHAPPRREVCVVTHVAHVYEITPELVAAVQALRKTGVSVYNQQVFTFENSRRFEAAALRRLLRLVGIDPYYTFCSKGKDEMAHYRVPIARLLQEAKEEARLFPGLVRTDEAVYNVPRLGKNYLLRGQHHDVVSVLPDGRRVYEFHPWEKKIRLTDTFVSVDVSIHEYLLALERRGERREDYESIWYYY